MKRVIQWYDSLPPMLRSILFAAASVIPVYLSAFLSYQVATIAKAQGPYGVAIHAAIALVLLGTVAVIFEWASHARAYYRQETETRMATIGHARSLMDRVVSKRVADIDERPVTAEHFVEDYCTSLRCIQRIVEAAYTVFEATYGKGIDSAERIDFEVTFMTKSYRDEEITIPAAANKDGHSPPSMQQRDQDPKLYDNTVTAKVYREETPLPHIIPNTTDPEYHEVYPRQKERIKSSIIYPVLSGSHELLGTMVVHCDRPGFFQHGDRKYWEDVLEIFAKRIALMKARMDSLWAAKNDGTQGVANLVGEPWF